MPRKLLPEEWVENIFSSLKAESVLGCWEWTKGLTSDGYGAVAYKGTGTKAHRALYRYLFGDIPPEIGVLHRCDNRKCCNPFHWFTGTQAKNIEDCVNKGRQPRAAGERNQGCILTADAVMKMRAVRRDTGRTYEDIAKEFGVAGVTAAQAINGYSWTHLPGAVVPKEGPVVSRKSRRKSRSKFQNKALGQAFLSI